MALGDKYFVDDDTGMPEFDRVYVKSLRYGPKISVMGTEYDLSIEQAAYLISALQNAIEDARRTNCEEL